jgi:hypothetical protein
MKSKNLVFRSAEVSFPDFVNKLIRENEGSHFFPDCFDDAIIGINEQTKSIVYSLNELIQLEINLRFEAGGLNPEYDEVDDDILIVSQDCILFLFQMFQYGKEGVLPTLYDENNESVYDPTAASKISSTIEYVFGNEVCRDSKILDMPTKVFTYDQMNEIVTANEAEYLRWIELQQFNPESSFELIPRELMSFDDDEEPIIRTVVKLLNEPCWLGFQDLTFDQWQEGKVINNNQDAA